MKSFTDSENRRWDVSLNVTTLKRVRNITDVDLLTVLDKPDLLTELAGDPVRFVDVLYVIVKPQADQLGVSDEQFGSALDGESIEHASNAFLEALVDFFPGARRAMLRRVMDRATQTKAETEQRIHKAIADGTVDKAIDHAIAGVNSTKSLDELESTLSH